MRHEGREGGSVRAAELHLIAIHPSIVHSILYYAILSTAKEPKKKNNNKISPQRTKGDS